MTVEMLIGGFIILMMVAVIVVKMTSTKSENAGSGFYGNYDSKSRSATKRR